LGELAKQVNLGTLDGRAKLAALANPYIQKMREGPLRSLILDELGRITRLSRDDLERSGTAPVKGDQHSRSANQLRRRGNPDAGAARTVNRALQLLLEKPELAEEVQNLELLTQADVPGIAVMIEALDYFHAHPGARASQLVAAWQETAKGAAI